MHLDVDKDWVDGWDFQTEAGLHVHGYVGQGVEGVVVGAEAPDGKKLVLKIFKPHLGFYIKEVPPGLSARQLYDLPTLNEKLASLVGNPVIDFVSGSANGVHAQLAALVWEHGVAELIADSVGSALADAVPTILASTSFHLRIQDWLGSDTDPDGYARSVNAPYWIPAEGPDFRARVAKIYDDLQEHARSHGGIVDLAGDPFYVWTIAVLEGFISEEEMPLAAKFLESRFGRVTDREDVADCLMHTSTILEAHGYFFSKDYEERSVRRAIRFLAEAGMIMRIFRADGSLLADFADVSSE